MQIVTDTHTHTVASGHAYSSLQENIAAAKQTGLKLMAMTDHASTMPGAPHYWHFENLKVIPRVVDGVGVLRGIEANILNPEGELDITESLAQRLDVVIASFHEPLFKPGDAATHTKALLAVIKGGKADILGHLGNPNFPFDIDTVVAAAAEHKVMIEINNSSFAGSRQGSDVNCERILLAAKRLGALLSFGSDAHISYQVGRFPHALALAQKHDFPAERLVSTKAERLLDALAARGKQLHQHYQEVL